LANERESVKHRIAALQMARWRRNAADLPDVSVYAQSIRAGDRLLLCMGLFSIFLIGSQNRVSLAAV
jgi:hypothetical protein